MTGSVTFKALALFACIIVSVAAVVAPASAGNGDSGQPLMPPGGAYTCHWVANHQAAALAAGVTCDYITFLTQMSGFTEGPQPAAPLSGGVVQAEVPTDGGTVGHGMYAWGPGEYSDCWQWYANYTPAPYYYEFYVENAPVPGTIIIHGKAYDTHASPNTCVASSAVRKWGGHNESYNQLSWTVFYTEQ